MSFYLLDKAKKIFRFEIITNYLTHTHTRARTEKERKRKRGRDILCYILYILLKFVSCLLIYKYKM